MVALSVRPAASVRSAEKPIFVTDSPSLRAAEFPLNPFTANRPEHDPASRLLGDPHKPVADLARPTSYCEDSSIDQRCAGNVQNRSVGSFLMSEAALARIEEGLRAQETGQLLPREGTSPDLVPRQHNLESSELPAIQKPRIFHKALPRAGQLVATSQDKGPSFQVGNVNSAAAAHVRSSPAPLYFQEPASQFGYGLWYIAASVIVASTTYVILSGFSAG